MNPWEWFSTTMPAGALVSGVGVSVFVVAILTDRLMTQAQHLRRVADIVAAHAAVVLAHEAEITRLTEHFARERQSLIEHHARELAEKDARAADLRESREGYKQATAVERARADAATEALGDVAPTLDSILHVMESLDRALPAAERGA